jgi:hypothetical protein
MTNTRETQNLNGRTYSLTKLEATSFLPAQWQLASASPFLLYLPSLLIHMHKLSEGKMIVLSRTMGRPPRSMFSAQMASFLERIHRGGRRARNFSFLFFPQRKVGTRKQICQKLEHTVLPTRDMMAMRTCWCKSAQVSPQLQVQYP